MPISKKMRWMCFLFWSCAISSVAGASDIDGKSESPNKAAPGKVLTAGVERSNVKGLLINLQQARTAAGNLSEEMSRHPVSVNNVGNSIGSVVTTIPQPTMDMTATLPPRKQQVDMYMSQISPIISSIKADLESVRGGETELEVSGKIKSNLDSQLENLSSDVDKAVATNSKLTELTQNEPYPKEIMHQVSELQKSLSSMEKTGKKMMRILEKLH